MTDKLLRLSEFTTLDEAFLEKTKKAIKRLNEYTKEYKKLETSTDLNSLEKLKREHSSYLSYFINFYSPIAAYKENHEFMQHEKKQLKSFCIEEMKEKSLAKSISEAEKTVYDYSVYKEKVRAIQEIKVFFIYVEEAYQYHKNILSRAIFQSISILSKEKQSTTD